jgi:anti-anti-sigma regulatory factor
MFHIRRSEDQNLVVFSLSGRIEEEQVAEVQKLLTVKPGVKPAGVVLDLTNVKLVDREAVKFLAACEAAGIELRNSPSYVREWIEEGKGQTHEPLH